MKALFLGSGSMVFVAAALTLACSSSDERDAPSSTATGGGAQTGGTGGDVGSGAAGSGAAASGAATGSGGVAATGGGSASGGAASSIGYCRSFANGSGTTQPCYVGSDGKGYCIADDGSTTALSGLPGTAVNVTGQNFTTAACAVSDQGAVYCGQYAQLGTGSAFIASGATQVSGTLNGQCALAGTTITCTGADVEAPVLPEGSPTQLGCYYHGCCALNDGGKMYCWGDTTAIGGTDTSVREVPLPSGKKAIGLGPGQDHLCALLEGGQVQCWGKDWNKQVGGLGDNSTTGNTLVASGAVAVAAGQFHTCIAFDDGHVECISGGQSEGAGLDQGVLTAVQGVDDAVALSAGKHYTCVLNGDGTIQCWGRIGGGPTPIAVNGPTAAACN